MRLPRRDAKTQRNAWICSGLFPRKDAVRCTELWLVSNVEPVEVTHRHGRIDSLQVNWSIVEGQKSAVRGLRLEVRGQRLEVRGQRIEVRRQKSEGIFPLSPCHLVPLSLTQNDTMRNGRCLPLSPCHLVPLSLTQSGNAKWALPSLVPHVP